jgi:hypothetical protein
MARGVGFGSCVVFIFDTSSVNIDAANAISVAAAINATSVL